MVQHEKRPDFNREPFQLGAFNEIANVRGKKTIRAECFSLGIIVNSVTISFHFFNKSAQPSLRDVEIKLPGGRSENVHFDDDSESFDAMGDLLYANVPDDFVNATNDAWITLKRVLSYPFAALRFVLNRNEITN